MGEQIDDRIDEQEVIHRLCCHALSKVMVGAPNLEFGFDGGGDDYEYQRTWVWYGCYGRGGLCQYLDLGIQIFAMAKNGSNIFAMAK